MPVVVEPRHADIRRYQKGWPCPAISQMPLENRGRRKRRRGMARRKCAAFAGWSIPLNRVLDALSQRLRHDDGPQHVEAEMRHPVGFWSAFGMGKHITS